MDNPKYVIILECDCEVAIVFSPLLDHRDVIGNKTAISAGFCQLPDKSHKYISVYGQSTTLELKSRVNEDIQIIRQSLNLNVSYSEI